MATLIILIKIAIIYFFLLWLQGMEASQLFSQWVHQPSQAVKLKAIIDLLMMCFFIVCISFFVCFLFQKPRRWLIHFLKYRVRTQRLLWVGGFWYFLLVISNKADPIFEFSEVLFWGVLFLIGLIFKMTKETDWLVAILGSLLEPIQCYFYPSRCHALDLIGNPFFMLSGYYVVRGDGDTKKCQRVYGLFSLVLILWYITKYIS